MTIRKRPPVAVPPQPTAEWPPPTDPFLVPPVDTAVTPVQPAAVLPGEVADDRFGLGMLIGLVVLLAVGGVIAAILLTRHHHNAAAVTTTTVVIKQTVPAAAAPAAGAAAASVVLPSFIGETKQTAASTLRTQGLTVRFATVRGPAPAGAVVGQDPAPHQSAAANSVVTLQISNGAAASPATVRVSTVTVTTAATSTTPPASRPTSTAATTPSKPATVTVPDVSGNQAQSAAQALGRAGFPVSIAYVPGTDPLGTILAESPSAGSTAPTTAHVTINASSGPGQKPQETVPDATGKTIPEAVAAMNGAGLRLFLLKKPVSDRALAGKVVEQTPAPGKTAPHNAQVLVYMGAFESTTR